MHSPGAWAAVWVALGATAAAAWNEAARGGGAARLGSGAPVDVVVGHLKGLVDGYVDKYNDEEAAYADTVGQMDKVIAASEDAESKARALDEKARITNEHDEKLAGLAGFVRTLDTAVGAVAQSPTSWMDEHPKLKEKVDAIYQAHPALLSKARHVDANATRTMSASDAAALVEQAEAYLAYEAGAGRRLRRAA